MNQTERKFYIAITGILVIAEVLSGISLWHYLRFTLGYQTAPSFCNINSSLNCDAVTASAYSTLLGIPQASWGILFYFVMFLLACSALLRSGTRAVSRISQVLFLLALWSLIYSIYLFLLSEIAVGTLCPTCLAMYSCNILLLYCSIRIIPARSWGVIKEGCASVVEFPGLVFSARDKTPEALPARRMTILFVLISAIVLSIPWAAEHFIGHKTSLPNQEKEIEKLIREWDGLKPASFTFEREGLRRDYAKGNPFAPVVLVEFSDFECPFCQKLAFDLNELLSDFPDQMEIVFKNFPLDRSCNSMVQRDMHRNSCFLAQLARCAGEQDRFWDMTEYLMSLREGLETQDRRGLIKEAVKALDLDGVGLTECMNSERQLEKVRSDVLEGISLKIDHTPALFINGRQVNIGDRAVLRELIKHIVK